MEQNIDLMLQYIAAADIEDMDRMIEAVICRCDELTPETETVFLPLPKEKREGQAEYLRRICNYLRGEYSADD